MNEQINEQLVLLQDELSRLKKVTDYIGDAKTNSSVIVQELEKVQQNYAQYTDELFTLYKQSISDFKDDVEAKIDNDVQRIEDIGNQINNTNQELVVETKNLLEQYEDVVDASDSVIATLNTIDFHAKLDDIHSKTEQLSKSYVDFRKAIEQKLNETQELIAEKNTQLKEGLEQLIVSEFRKCKDLIQEHTEQNFMWQEKQEKEMKSLKLYTLIICGLIILSMIMTFIVK